jgi:hypothetical protein
VGQYQPADTSDAGKVAARIPKMAFDWSPATLSRIVRDA